MIFNPKVSIAMNQQYRMGESFRQLLVNKIYQGPKFIFLQAQQAIMQHTWIGMGKDHGCRDIVDWPITAMSSSP